MNKIKGKAVLTVGKYVEKSKVTYTLGKLETDAIAWKNTLE